jgi:purine-cytosine permease-like protein
MYKIIAADQKEYGPVGADQIRLWIAEGRVNAQTQVQAVGATDWKSVGDVTELAAGLPNAPAPRLVTISPPAPSSRGTCQMAVWAMVAGILSVPCCQILGLVAVVLGVVALSQLKQHPELAGRGFAITGIVLGALALLIVIMAVVIFILSPQLLQHLQNALPQ